MAHETETTSNLTPTLEESIKKILANPKLAVRLEAFITQLVAKL